MSTTEEVIYNLEKNAPMTNREIAQQEVSDFKRSVKLGWMTAGDLYYRNKTAILDHKRYVIGDGGAKIEAKNLANNKLVFGFIRKLVDQKIGYLLSKPISITSDGPAEYKDELDRYFGKSFLRQLKNLGKNSINGGIGWLQVYYSESGELSFKVIPTTECVPLWKDGAHTELDAMIRFYPVEFYEAKVKKTIQIIEFWDQSGVMKWVQESTSNYAPYEELHGHFSVQDANGEVQQLNWDRLPFVPFKYNDEEMPLVEILKTLVDDYDKHVSFNSSNLEDLPNDIIVLKNYDGADLGEARRNLAQYRMTKVSGDGGIDTLSVNIDTTALTSHITELRKSIYEFGRGVDTQSDKFGNSPSGIALRFLYSDLDMDANIIETEFQASLEQLLWFVNQHLANTTGQDYSEVGVDFIFNRDILINETETVNNVKSSIGIISEETAVANHPFVTNVQDELDRIKKERAEPEPTATDQSYGGTGDGLNNPPTKQVE